MLKQQFNKVKKLLIVLLAVFFIATLTITTASAATSDGITYKEIKGSVVEETQLEQVNAALEKGPVLLEFSAEWCESCNEMKPILKQLAAEYNGKATIMSVDVDESPTLADYFGAGDVFPDSTVIVGVKNNKYSYMQENGKVTTDRSDARITGLTDKQEFENVLDLALGNTNAQSTDEDTDVLIADFTSSVTSGKAPLKVTFTDESTGDPTKWKWDFGDGTTSSVQNPTHKYSEAGSYTVTLTATNNKGSDTVTRTDYIVVTKPTAAFSNTDEDNVQYIDEDNVQYIDEDTNVLVAQFTSDVTKGSCPLCVKFTDTSTGEPTKWKWDFGDGTTSSKQNPKHEYSKVGCYTVTLTVTNDEGSDTVTRADYIVVTKKDCRCRWE